MHAGTHDFLILYYNKLSLWLVDKTRNLRMSSCGVFQKYFDILLTKELIDSIFYIIDRLINMNENNR